MPLILPKSSSNLITPISYNLNDILDDPKLSFLVDRSVPREYYHLDPISEGQVIGLRRSLTNKKETKSNKIVPINEMTAKEIVRGADAPRLRRSKDTRIVCRFMGVTNFRGWLKFDVTSQFTLGKHYLVHVQLQDTKDVKYFKDFKKRDIIRLLLSGHLKIRCSCPDFRYRMSYQAYQMGYGLFKEMRYPHIANPKLVGTVCKHCLAVLRVMNANWLRISKAMQNSKYFQDRYNDNLPTPKSKLKGTMSNRGRRNTTSK